MMLNIYFGDMPEAVYNTSVYFNNTYKDSWITNQMTKDIIKAVDSSDVIDEKNRDADFKFDLYRNITIVRGKLKYSNGYGSI